MNGNDLTQMYIIDDMKEIENILNNNIHNIDILKKTHRKIDGKYQSCIKDWSKSMYGWIPNVGFSYECLGEQSLIDNLESMLYKLSAFSINLNTINKENKNMIFQLIINNNNTNNNNNSNRINMSIDFSILKEQFSSNAKYSSDEKK